jgi:hypothetical protein
MNIEYINNFYNLNKKVSYNDNPSNITTFKLSEGYCNDEKIINQCITEQINVESKVKKKIDSNIKDRFIVKYKYKDLTKTTCRPLIQFTSKQLNYFNKAFEDMYKKLPLHLFDPNLLSVPDKVNKLYRYMKKRSNFTLVALDVSKAFDSIDRDQIRKVMIKYELDDFIHVIDYLDQIEYIYSQDVIIHKKVGIPQGCAFSTYIFSLCMFDIMKIFSFDFIELFVDDVLFCQNNNKNIPIWKIIQELKKFNLKLNNTKCKYINYGSTCKSQKQLKQYNLIEINKNECIKWLGVYITPILDEYKEVVLNANTIMSIQKDLLNKKIFYDDYKKYKYYNYHKLLYSIKKSYEWYKMVYCKPESRSYFKQIYKELVDTIMVP